MHVYLLRHGIAEETAPGGDAERELTSEGRAKLTDVLKRVARAGIRPGLILTSPLIRAEQTAQLAAKLLDCPVSPSTTTSLEPHGTPQALWEEVRNHREIEQLMMAGHEPLLSSTVSYFLNAPGMQVDFKKGAIVAVEFQSFRGDPRGVLKWMLTAKLCQ